MVSLDFISNKWYLVIVGDYPSRSEIGKQNVLMLTDIPCNNDSATLDLIKVSASFIKLSNMTHETVLTERSM